jgi:8-oxo-dGTP diphosphatase
MPRENAIPGVHLLLIRAGEILLIRRINTGYADGQYSVIAGHLKAGESAVDALLREAREEAGIEVRRDAIAFRHVMHWRKPAKLLPRVDFFFSASSWLGEPRNMEPHKCDEFRWSPADSLPPETVDYIRVGVGRVLSGIAYSEFGWD